MAEIARKMISSGAIREGKYLYVKERMRVTTYTRSTSSYYYFSDAQRVLVYENLKVMDGVIVPVGEVRTVHITDGDIASSLKDHYVSFNGGAKLFKIAYLASSTSERVRFYMDDLTTNSSFEAYGVADKEVYATVTYKGPYKYQNQAL